MLNKSSRLATALGVTKFIAINYMNLSHSIVLPKVVEWCKKSSFLC